MTSMTLAQVESHTVAVLPRPSAAPRNPRGRVLTVVLWTFQILLAVLFVFGGINKLLGLQAEVVTGFDRIGFGTWFRYFVGALELAGGVGLLIPRLSGAAALGLAGVMAGAIATHLTVLPPAYFAAIPAVLGAGFLLIARARRSEIRELVESISR